MREAGVPSPLNVAALGAHAASIREFFWCTNGTRTVYIPALIGRLNAELYSKALYPHHRGGRGV
jgi:hypothetical protein